MGLHNIIIQIHNNVMWDWRYATNIPDIQPKWGPGAFCGILSVPQNIVLNLNNAQCPLPIVPKSHREHEHIRWEDYKCNKLRQHGSQLIYYTNGRRDVIASPFPTVLCSHYSKKVGDPHVAQLDNTCHQTSACTFIYIYALLALCVGQRLCIDFSISRANY